MYFISRDDLVACSVWLLNFMSCVLYFCADLYMCIVRLLYFISGDYNCEIHVLKWQIILQSARKQVQEKNRSVGPQIDADGFPSGIHNDALSKHISQYVCHCDEFSLDLTWPGYKNLERVEALYFELAISYLVINIIAYVYALMRF